jgi:hypothetical protein
MQTRHWMLTVSTLMFVASIWFVLAQASGGSGAGGAGGPVTEPIATVKQLMNGIVAPASGTVYQSVSIIIDHEGEHENHPRSDEEWDVVAASAAAIAEAGGLLMMDGRARDERWVQISQQMIDASLISMRAAQDQDKEALLASGEALNASCDSCHQAYGIDE